MKSRRIKLPYSKHLNEVSWVSITAFFPPAIWMYFWSQGMSVCTYAAAANSLWNSSIALIQNMFAVPRAGWMSLNLNAAWFPCVFVVSPSVTTVILTVPLNFLSCSYGCRRNSAAWFFTFVHLACFPPDALRAAWCLFSNGNEE